MKTSQRFLLDVGVYLSVLQLLFGVSCIAVAGSCYKDVMDYVSGCPMDSALLQSGTGSCPSWFNTQSPLSCSDNILGAMVVIGTSGNESSGLSSQVFSSSPCYTWVRCRTEHNLRQFVSISLPC